jgi:CRP/FNR family cyclic AMP-dependent transcriptional regulator
MAAPMEKDPLKEARWLLGNCVLFAGLSREERAAIAAHARIRTLEAGETVFSIGSPGDQMMAVLSGAIRISVPSSQGKELVLAIIQSGDVFGELSVLDGKERSADAVAESASALAILDRRDILTFFERNPSALLKLVEVLCERLRRTDQILADVALLQLPARLARAVLRTTRPDAAHPRTEKIKFSQQQLANMVGGTRERVNKLLRQWHSKGIVDVSQGSISVLDRSALESIADQGSEG